MGIRELLGKNVKYYRSCRGYSQEDLAGRCNDIKDKDALSGRAFISGIECGRRNITLDKIEILAEALGVEPRCLFEMKHDSERL